MQILVDIETVVEQEDGGLFRLETRYTYEDGSTAIRECLIRRGGRIAIPPDAREGTVLAPLLAIVGQRPEGRAKPPADKDFEL